MTSAEYIVFFGMFTTDPRLVENRLGLPFEREAHFAFDDDEELARVGTHARRDLRAGLPLVVCRMVVLVVDDDFAPVRLALVARLQIGELDVQPCSCRTGRPCPC